MTFWILERTKQQPRGIEAKGIYIYIYDSNNDQDSADPKDTRDVKERAKMPLPGSLALSSELEEIIEADHEETTTRHEDDFDLDDVTERSRISEATSTNNNNIEEVTRVLMDENNQDDNDVDSDSGDDDDDLLFHDYANVRTGSTTGNPPPHALHRGSNDNNSNNNDVVQRSSSITSNSSSSKYLQGSSSLAPLVEDDGDVSTDFCMPDDVDQDDDDDSGIAVQDMGYEDMDDVANRENNEHYHSASPRLSAFFHRVESQSSVPASTTTTTTTTRNNSRPSFVSTTSRRVSTETDGTYQSAPAVLMHSTSNMDGAAAAALASDPNQNSSTARPQQRRRVTIQVDPVSNEHKSSSSLASRSSRFRLASKYGKSSNTYQSDNLNSSTKSSIYGSILNRRRSTRNPLSDNGKNMTGTSTNHNVVHAVEQLNMYQTSDFEYTSAAAAIVTATTASGKRNYGPQFGQGDHVLVILAILGLADAFGNKELYTIDPVNKLGYPQNEGKTEAQSQGPYLYVLCVVKQVHFDEDERYYTVLRCDTNKEQRADPGYMEPIRDEESIEIAYQAAQRSRTSMTDQHKPTIQQIGFCERCWKSMMRLGTNTKRRVIPTYIRTRNDGKKQLQRLLHGEPGCALNFRFSGINFLVCCSLLFLFHDVFALGYLPPSADFAVDLIGMYVYFLLNVFLLASIELICASFFFSQYGMVYFGY